MDTQTNISPEPTPDALAARTARRLFVATRPQFLTASALPVLVGTAWGLAGGQTMDGARFVLAFLATVLVHAACNVLNDVGDEIGGSDRINEGRMYPFSGGSRMIQNGVMSVAGMTRLGIALLVAAIACGALLALVAGPGVILFGLAGIALGLAYSLPPLQLAGRGIGEASVAVAFGVLPVCGAAWLQSGLLDGTTLLLSLPVSLWVAAILLVNEVPDIQADAATGKRTLAVSLGAGGAMRLYIAIQVFAVAGVGALGLSGNLHYTVVLVPAAMAALALRRAAGIGNGDRAALLVAIRTTLLVHALGCIALLVWAVAARFSA